MKHVVDKNYFPGFVRKAVTFTIDDGNIKNDKKFIDIVRPAGIFGTFNLCAPTNLSPEEYREMYKGFEIANHVKLHPELFVPGVDYIFSDEPFCKESADARKLYPHESEKGVFYINDCYYGSDLNRWFRICDSDTYVRLTEECKRELEEIFGEGSVRSFVWPFGRQKDYGKVLEYIKKSGYYGARDAGTPDKDFSMPKDRMNWKYNANDRDLLSKMEQFAALPDDGELKLFSFGVHSIDYEVGGRWGDLLDFAERYGNRREEYYYATVGEIFDYEDAISRLTVTDDVITNPSPIPVYITLDGEPIIIASESTVKLR